MLQALIFQNVGKGNKAEKKAAAPAPAPAPVQAAAPVEDDAEIAAVIAAVVAMMSIFLFPQDFTPSSRTWSSSLV